MSVEESTPMLDLLRKLDLLNSKNHEGILYKVLFEEKGIDLPKDLLNFTQTDLEKKLKMKLGHLNRILEFQKES